MKITKKWKGVELIEVEEEVEEPTAEQGMTKSETASV